MGVVETPVDCANAESACNTLRPAIYANKKTTGLGGEYQVAGANRRWRCQFRYRGSRRRSAVAQLFSLGSMTLFIMLAFFAVSAVAVVFFTDRRDVVFVAPVGNAAQTAFGPIYRHESMVPGFRFVTDCTDWFIHIFMSVHAMLPNNKGCFAA